MIIKCWNVIVGWGFVVTVHINSCPQLTRRIMGTFSKRCIVAERNYFYPFVPFIFKSIFRQLDDLWSWIRMSEDWGIMRDCSPPTLLLHSVTALAREFREVESLDNNYNIYIYLHYLRGYSGVQMYHLDLLCLNNIVYDFTFTNIGWLEDPCVLVCCAPLDPEVLVQSSSELCLVWLVCLVCLVCLVPVTRPVFNGFQFIRQQHYTYWLF